MTNTTEITFSEMVTYCRERAERQLADLTEKLPDEVVLSGFAYAAQWKMRTAVRVETSFVLYDIGVLHGAEAMTARLAEFLSASPTSTDPFANAVALAQAAAAAEVLAEFRKLLPAEVLLARL